MEIFLESHHFLLIKKHTPPPLFYPASADLSIRKTEKLSDGVTAVSGTDGVSHVSVKQKMLQSLMSRWKLILALRSSILFSKDWTVHTREDATSPIKKKYRESSTAISRAELDGAILAGVKQALSEQQTDLDRIVTVIDDVLTPQILDLKLNF